MMEFLDEGPIIDDISIMGRKEDMKIPSGEFAQIPRGLEWGCTNRPKYTILDHNLRIFWIIKGGKGTPITNLKNNFAQNFMS
jgi:hypothetical protein